MCGIAGYCLSKKWSDSLNIVDDTVEKVLKEAWFHNIHRGHQAAGFFGVNKDTNETLMFKSPGQADTIFKEDIVGKGKLEPFMILGAHTREPSMASGDPAENINNHPVHYNGVLTIHNGNILNDIQIKKRLKMNFAKEKQLIGEVDSSAISIVLSEIENPEENPQAIAAALSELSGNFSIHSVWEDYPGLSLLAKGGSNPLLIAYHESGHGLFYGSEKESVWYSIKAMGLDPEDGWTFRSMSVNTFILVRDGYPLEWGSFVQPPRTNTTRANFYRARYLPADGNRAAQLVYMTDWSVDFALDAKYVSMIKAPAKKAVYSRRRVTDINKAFPVAENKGQNDIASLVCEADRVFEDGKYVYAIFGKVEVVISKVSRVVVDIMNHDLFKVEDRWVDLEKIDDAGKPVSALKDNEKSWGEFVKDKTNVVPLTNIKTEYEFSKENDSKKSRTRSTSTSSNSTTATTNNVTGVSKIGFQLHKPDFYLNWKGLENEEQNVRAWNENVVYHMHEPTLTFVHDNVCSVHQQRFSQHDHPFDCKAVLMSAAYTIACFADLNMWWALDYQTASGEPIIKYELPSNKAAKCASTAEIAPSCEFIESEVVRVYANKQYWEILAAEECWNCGAIRKLAELPPWFEKLDHSGVLVSFSCFA